MQLSVIDPAQEQPQVHGVVSNPKGNVSQPGFGSCFIQLFCVFVVDSWEFLCSGNSVVCCHNANALSFQCILSCKACLGSPSVKVDVMCRG